MAASYTKSMADRRALNGTELDERVQALVGWQVRDGKLHREYRFADFVQAIGYMTTAAFGIEKMNHHPDWRNVYGRVSVDLTTHDAGGITAKDFELAHHLDHIAAQFS